MGERGGGAHKKNIHMHTHIYISNCTLVSLLLDINNDSGFRPDVVGVVPDQFIIVRH